MSRVSQERYILWEGFWPFFFFGSLCPLAETASWQIIALTFIWFSSYSLTSSLSLISFLSFSFFFFCKCWSHLLSHSVNDCSRKSDRIFPPKLAKLRHYCTQYDLKTIDCKVLYFIFKFCKLFCGLILHRSAIPVVFVYTFFLHLNKQTNRN